MQNRTLTYPSRTILDKPSLLVILFFCCFAFWTVDFWRNINIRNFDNVFGNSEVFRHYSYLPAIFQNDGSFFISGKLINYNIDTPRQLTLPSYNYGLSAMYAPFYFLAELFASTPPDPAFAGFSQYYGNFIHWGAFFYVAMGLIMLRQLLLARFNEIVVAFTLMMVVFGNFMFYYFFAFNEPPPSHLFFLYCAFLRLSEAWHSNRRDVFAVGLGVVAGLISLIQPMDLYLLAFFIFWRSAAGIKPQSHLPLLRALAVMAVTALLLWVPQCVFNYRYTGSLFYYYSINDFFDFTDVKMTYALFSTKTGWFVYSPLFALAVTGIWLRGNKLPVPKVVFALSILYMLFMYSSFRGGGIEFHYGRRFFLPSIVWLSFPLAGIIQGVFYCESTGFGTFIKKGLLMIFLFFCFCYSIGMTYRINNGLIYPATISDEEFFELFMKHKLPNHERRYWAY